VIAHVGIDPGITGAVAVLHADGTVQFHDTPHLVTEVSKKPREPGGATTAKRKIYDEAGMAAILRPLAGAHVTIEQVNAMPARGPGGVRIEIGATSMFNFGVGYGLWLGMLAALQLPHDRVAPRRWKAALLKDIGKDDGAVAAVASRLYPATADRLRGSRGGILIGRVDALLLAHYGKITAVSAG